ncbi:MAG TPA: amino acid adenylation domain-containing protein [Gaiellaceae bacterium]|nr:amino acid adenylation domain-containing protein [Gaiellaceae bacterium]
MTGLLQEYVARQAETRPDAVAVVLGDSRVTYGTLDVASSRQAALLRELGCRPRDRVCLLVSKSPAAICGMLASLKAGCAYVPVDVENPAARVELILRAVEPHAILADPSAVVLLDQLAAAGVLAPGTAIVSVIDEPLSGERFESAASASDWSGLDEIHEPALSSEEVAHILFTSGSTGTPKGVMITHANVIHFVEWATRYFNATCSDRFSGHPPLHFDLSTYDIYGAFRVGAELHLVPPGQSSLPHLLAEFIRSSRVTRWFAVPSAYALLAAFDAVRHGDFPSLRHALWCGEVLPAPVLRYWMERLPHVAFTNLYGPTEATIASSFYTVREPPQSDEPVPIGSAWEGGELLVLDERMRPVPPGEVGEIYIGGVGLSPGYWRDPERTRQAFVPWPGRKGERLYRTGDLGRVDDSGLVHFLGRRDSQVKHRGYRIELGEIETALGALEGVRECAVVATESEGFEGTTLCAAYATTPGASLDERALRRALRERLPSYMIPSAWLAFEELPKNANGKIDRPLLRQRFRELRGNRLQAVERARADTSGETAGAHR